MRHAQSNLRTTGGLHVELCHRFLVVAAVVVVVVVIIIIIIIIIIAMKVGMCV